MEEAEALEGVLASAFRISLGCFRKDLVSVRVELKDLTEQTAQTGDWMSCLTLPSLS